MLNLLSRQSFNLSFVVALLLVCQPAFSQTHRSVKKAVDKSAGTKELENQAAKGDSLSQCRLGLKYLLGKEVPQDYHKAYYWLQMAADKGFMQAQYLLGGMYKNGNGVPQNYEKAAEWYQKAVDQGDELAQHDLASIQDKLGNFNFFQTGLLKTGLFTPKGVLNGSSMYQSKQHKDSLLFIRPVDGYCCEGLLSLQPMEDADLESYLLFIYMPLQNSLARNNRESIVSGSKARVSLLREQISTNLKQSDRTEFAFDHLNVRAECPPVSDAELRAGRRPQLTIKLWVP